MNTDCRKLIVTLEASMTPTWCFDQELKVIRIRKIWRSEKKKIIIPLDTGHKLNVHKTFRRRPGRLLNVLCTFSLRPVSTATLKELWIHTWVFDLYQIWGPLITKFFGARWDPSSCKYNIIQRISTHFNIIQRISD